MLPLQGFTELDNHWLSELNVNHQGIDNKLMHLVNFSLFFFTESYPVGPELKHGGRITSMWFRFRMAQIHKLSNIKHAGLDLIPDWCLIPSAKLSEPEEGLCTLNRPGGIVRKVSSKFISNRVQNLCHGTTQINWLPLEERSGDSAARPKGYGCHVTLNYSCGMEVEWEGGHGWGSSAQESRTEEGESLPLTGPMYIISEARMKIDKSKKKERHEKVEGRNEQAAKKKPRGQI